MGTRQQVQQRSSTPTAHHHAMPRRHGPGNAARAAQATDDAATIPRQDMVYEHLAHRLGYGEVSASGQHMLDVWGYGKPIVFEGKAGFAMTLYPVAGATESSERPLRPVLSIRGTEPTQIADLLTDVDPAGVGSAQLLHNEAVILKALRALQANGGGKVDVVGHSLGGAVAQLIAAAHPEFVGRVVAFQAPGVPANMAHKMAAYNKHATARGEEPVQTTYHLIDNDQVHRAGDARLPGQTYVHDNDSSHALAAHTSLILAQGGRHRLDSTTRTDHPDGISPNRQSGWQEGARETVGKVLLRGGTSKKFDRWYQVRQLFKDGHTLLPEIREPDNRAQLQGMYPEIVQLHAALEAGDDARVRQLVAEPPRRMLPTDVDRMRAYAETYSIRHRRKNPLAEP